MQRPGKTKVPDMPCRFPTCQRRNEEVNKTPATLAIVYLSLLISTFDTNAQNTFVFLSFSQIHPFFAMSPILMCVAIPKGTCIYIDP